MQALLDEHDSIDGAAADDNLRVENFFHCFVPLPKSSDKAYYRRTLALPPEDTQQPPTSSGGRVARRALSRGPYGRMRDLEGRILPFYPYGSLEGRMAPPVPS